MSTARFIAAAVVLVTLQLCAGKLTRSHHSLRCPCKAGLWCKTADEQTNEYS